jgi:hypothetical protein
MEMLLDKIQVAMKVEVGFAEPKHHTQHTTQQQIQNTKQTFLFLFFCRNKNKSLKIFKNLFLKKKRVWEVTKWHVFLIIPHF